eukprot:UN09627
MEIFSNRAMNEGFQDMLTGFMVGNNAKWWRNRHSKHHAQPQVHGRDGDLKTMPLLAWCEVLAEKCPDWLLKYQHIYFYRRWDCICLYGVFFQSYMCGELNNTEECLCWWRINR